MASRTTAPAIGGAVGLCIASTNGTAYVVGIGKNVPNDMSKWDETAQMTLRGVRHNTLIQEYVVLMQGVCGGQEDAAEVQVQGQGSRLIQNAASGKSVGDDKALFDAQSPTLNLRLSQVGSDSKTLTLTVEEYLKAVISRRARQADGKQEG